MKDSLQMTEFDELIGSSSLQMMKAFLPFLEPSMQQWAAIYIQMQELQNAIALFQTPDKPPPWPRQAMPPPEKLIEALRPYGGPAESAALDQMKSAMEAMKLYQKFSDLQQKASGRECITVIRRKRNGCGLCEDGCGAESKPFSGSAGYDFRL